MDQSTKLLPGDKLLDTNGSSDAVKPPSEEKVQVKNKESVAYTAPKLNPAFEDDDHGLNGAADSPKKDTDNKDGESGEPAADVTSRDAKSHLIPSPVINRSSLCYTPPTFEESMAAEIAIRRRNSDFGAISAPRPENEDLALKDLKSRGSLNLERGVGDVTDGRIEKRHSMDIPRGRTGPQWSPRLARKKMEQLDKNNGKGERRMTLAAIAAEAGYTGPDTDEIDSGSKNHNHESRLPEDGVGEDAPEVMGEIYLTLKYELNTSDFKVHVHCANNLAASAAKTESPDPYVKTYLLPDKRSKRKTKTKKDTLNPEFDECLLYNIGYDDLTTRVLWTSVWHNDVFGRNIFLGEVHIPIGSLVDSGFSLESPQPKWFKLCEERVEESLTPLLSELILSLKYVTADKVRKKGKKGSATAGDKGEVHVHLMEAKNLPGKDSNGMSDPYCKVTLLPDKKGKSRHKTPVVKCNLNPSFDYKLILEGQSIEDLKERVLEISLWDYDLASTDEFLGGVRLGLGTSSNIWDDSNPDEAQIWQTILSRHNVWLQVVLPLRVEMKEGAKL